MIPFRFRCSFNRIKTKVVSLIVAESMLFGSLAYCDQGNLLKPDEIKIPKEIGSVREKYTSEKKR